MLVDEVTIRAKAGKGGRGAVAFNTNMESLGPTGGSGGNGGSIYAEGSSDLGALGQFRFMKELEAKDGGNGRGQFIDGPRGEDLVFRVPIGTVIRNIETGFDNEVLHVGEKILVARGGYGGKGNFQYRSATNRSPEEFQPGLPGEDFELRLELKLIAGVGLVGLPNAGKSSLLNSLTKAQSKVANYPFTTLEPNLGDYYGLVIADIPGIIEGASAGRGLGTKFLRHIERTKTIFHLVAADSEDVARDYQTIKNELATHNLMLVQKDEFVFLSKSDTVDPKKMKEQIKALAKVSGKKQKDIIPLSILEDESIEQVKKLLNTLKA
jgi:GTP-binding protein